MKYTDKQGLFSDFNFKLVVMDAMLGQEPAFLEELEALKDEHEDAYWDSGEYAAIPAVCEYVANLHLTQEDLDKVTDLCFDGGLEIYFYLLPDWDGEDDFFDVKSIDGWQHLKNLERVECISMIDEALLKVIADKGITIS
jgi:hypothetical protein